MTAIRHSRKAHLDRGHHGRQRLRNGELPREVTNGRIPRVTRLMALAIRFEQLIRDGIVRDQAELALLGNVSRARMTQIMNLLNLAPEIQEVLLFLPRVEHGKDSVTERELREVVADVDWGKQREMWTNQFT